VVCQRSAVEAYTVAEVQIMGRARIGTAVFLFTQGAAFAQIADAPPTFEAASVKPAAPPSGGFRVTMGGDRGRVNYSNVSLQDIIAQAYQVNDYQISGPDWLGSQRFDIIATFPPNTSRGQIPLMLQALLAERFKLTLHREWKDVPGYALVVTKNGPKLKESPVDPAATAGDGSPASDSVAVIGGGGRGLGGGGGLGRGGGARRNAMNPLPAGGSTMTIKGRGHVEGKKQGLPSIAYMLAREVDRPVVDETGLKGTYDYTLDWTPDGSDSGPRFRPGGQGDGGGAGAAAHATGDSSAPSLMAAIQQQLGLKLEARKVPVDLLLIDHAEKVPTQN
jgi:uncharacterized protein (TIGR03435 family)